MGSLIPFYRKAFINSLSDINKKEMRGIDVGNEILIDSYCGSVLNGRLDSFEEDGITLIINRKSKVVIRGESIKKLKKT
jgi:hypothetical protein